MKALAQLTRPEARAKRRGRGRGELHQAGDRSPGTVERGRLQHGAEAEEEGDEPGLGPLADRHGADHREAHEDVHVDLARAQREEGGARHETAAGDHGGGEEIGCCCRRESAGDEAGDDERAGHHDQTGAPVGQPEAATRARAFVRVTATSAAPVPSPLGPVRRRRSVGVVARGGPDGAV